MRTPVRFGFGITLITALALFYPGSNRSSALAQTFTVTTTADSGAGSFRQAILNVDSDTNPVDTIVFQIPGTGAVQQIVLQSQLPTVTHPVLIDGYTQGGAQPNTLSNGINAVLAIQLRPAGGVIATGLQIASTNCIVRGLVIGGFNTGIAITTAGNVVEGNFIGTDPTGKIPDGNLSNGVLIVSSSNMVGGTTPASRNLISGNAGDGMDVSATNNTVLGNFIGTDITGTNALGNGNNGVLLDEAIGNTIGGTNLGAGNVISGNSNNGVVIADDTVSFPSEFNVVQGNLIGTDVTGANIVSNGASGILISDSLSGAMGTAEANTVGGLQPGAGNLIAGNGSNGVTVVGTNAVDDAIFGNSIFSNAVLGIELGTDGVVSNHPFGVASPGPNNFQNFPVLTSAACSNGGVLVEGIITNSGSISTAHLEFFSNVACDPSGFGQGQMFIGSTNVTTDVNGGASFAITFTTNLNGGFITATASDSSSNTSEFSECIHVSLAPIISVCATSIVASANANCEAAVPDFTSAVQASDDCAPSNSLVFTQSPTNGTIAFVGTNLVTITVADQASNTTSCTADFIVVATNTGPPVITQCATSLVASAGAGCQAVMPDFTAQVQATDGCAPTGSLVKTQSPAAGTLVGGGARPVSISVTITVANQASNTTSCVASFVVVNTPMITQCATSIVASANGSCQATVPDFTAQVQAIDNCLSGNLVITQSPASGSSASLGTNLVTITVEDQASNTASCVANFIVVDTTPPVITACAPSITFPAGPGCQTNVPDFTAQVQATDNCSPNNLIITQSPTNGDIAFLGTNMVTITVADPAGNTTNCTTTFIVANTAPPNITCQSNITVTVGSSNTSAVVTFPTPTATENCSVTTTVTCVPPSGSIFPVGTTPVVCTAVDAVGNTASCTFNVTVLSPKQVIVDIEPGMCPNVLNTNNSVILVAIVGTESLDVRSIIPASVTLNGVLADTNSVIEDVSSPFVFTHGCPKKKKDGILDLVVEFNVDELIASLGHIRNGEVKVLTVNGTFLDGNTFEGQDKLKISTKKCKLPKGLKNPF